MNLTKSKYCLGIQCPKILWMELNMPEQFDQSAIDEARIKTGNEVGNWAKKYFGEFTEVSFVPDKNEMIAETQHLLDAGTNVITEASFAFAGNFCRVDLLRKVKGGFELIEVKSSTISAKEGTDGVKSIYFDDMAYQYYVLTNSGLNINKVSIMQLNREYVHQGKLDEQKLFVITDCTGEILAMQDDIAANIADIKAVAEQSAEPEILIGSGCAGCGFQEWCFRELPPNNVFAIGWRMRSNKKDEAYNSGIITFEDILDSGLKLSEKQMLQVKAVVQNLPPYINTDEIRSFLSQIKYPLYHLDFETCQQAVPQWDNVSPYMQIPFQYSLHIQDAPCGPVLHKEFLGKEGIDPRRSLAERLCADIPMNVCLMAYNMSFEKTQLKGLAKLFPDLTEHLMNMHDHMIDLMIPFQTGAYYCREMGGSYSIKKVLPALCPDDPELDYHTLNLIHDGGEAMAAFASLHEKPPEEIAEVRAALLAYCRLDTLAMVKILEKLYALVG